MRRGSTWMSRGLDGLCSGNVAVPGEHLCTAAFTQFWGQSPTSPTSRQSPSFPFPSWISFNMQIYEAGNWWGQLESRLGIITEKNEQSVLQAVTTIPGHISDVISEGADLGTLAAFSPFSLLSLTRICGYVRLSHSRQRVLIFPVCAMQGSVFAL